MILDNIYYKGIRCNIYYLKQRKITKANFKFKIENNTKKRLRNLSKYVYF